MTARAHVPSARRAFAAAAALAVFGGLLGPSTVLAAPDAQVYGSLLSHSFSPDGDGVDDSFDGSVGINQPAEATVTISPSAGGAAVRTFSGPTVDGEFDFAWDGKDSAGAAAPYGDYVVEAVLTGATDGAVGTKRVTAALDRTRTIDWLGPVAGSVLRQGDEVELRIPEVYGMGRLALQQVGTGVVVSGSYYQDYEDRTKVKVSVVPGALPNGPAGLEAHLTWYDRFSYQHELVTATSRSYDLQSSPTLEITSQPRYVFPEQVNAFGGRDVLYASYALGRPAALTAVAKDAAGGVVRSFSMPSQSDAGERSLPVSGRTDFGDDAPLLPAGEYSLVLTATFADDTVITRTLAFGVAHGQTAFEVVAPISGATLDGPSTAVVSVPAPLVAASGWARGPEEANGIYDYIGYLSGPAAGQTAEFQIDSSTLPSGPSTLEFSISGRDPLGGYHYLPEATVPVVIDSTLRVTGDTAPATISPDTDPPVTSVTTNYRVNRASRADITVSDSDGNLVRTLQSDAHLSSGQDSTAVWNGTDDSRLPVGGGDYVLSIVARDAADATSTSTLSRPITVDVPLAGTLTTTGGTRVAGEVPFVFTPAAGIEPSYISLYAGGSYAGNLTEDEASGTWLGTVSTSYSENGPYSLVASVVTTAGDTRQSSRLALTYANPVDLTVHPNAATLRADDPVNDRWDLSLSLTQPAVVTAAVADSTGAVVRTLTSGTAERYPRVFWDGRTTAGDLAPVGSYTVTVTADESVVPSTDSGTTTVVVGRSQVGVLTSPVANSVLADRTTFTYSPPPSVTGIYSVQFSARTPSADRYPDRRYLGNGTLVGGVYTLDADTSGLSDGPYEVFAEVSWNDPTTGYAYGGTTAVPVTVKQPGAIAESAGSRYFSPDGDGYEDEVTVTYRMARQADVVVAVQKQDGSPVGVTSSRDDTPVGTSSFTWNGRTSAGAALPPGRYAIVVTSLDADGKTDTETIPVGITGAPGALTGPGDESPSSGDVRFDWTPAEGSTSTEVTLYADDGAYVASGTLNAAGFATFSVDLTRQLVGYDNCSSAGCTPAYRAYPNGRHTFFVQVGWKDALGAAHSTWRSPTTPIVAVSPLRVTSSPASGFVGRVLEGGDVQPFSGTVTTDQPTTWKAVVRSGTGTGGEVVRTLSPEAGTAAAYGDVVPWDGTADGGANVPDGAYTLVATLTEGYAQLSQVVTVPIEVRRGAIGSFTSPQSGDTIGGEPRFTYAAAPGVTLTSVEFMDSRGNLINESPATQTSPGVWSAVVNARARLDAGGQDLSARLRYRTAATPTGITRPYQHGVQVTVAHDARVYWPGTYLSSGAPAGSTFTPNGDGEQDAWSRKYQTFSSGLPIRSWIEDSSGSRVRTLSDGSTTSEGMLGYGCEDRQETVTTNGEESFYRYTVCDDVSWNGRTDSGALVDDGMYSLHLEVSNGSDTSAITPVPIQVEKRMPVVGDLALDSVVADTMTVRWTPRLGVPAGASQPRVASVGSVKIGVDGVLALQTAQRQEDGSWTATVDLPTSLPDALTFSVWATWSDQYDDGHTSIQQIPVTVDVTTFDLAFATSRTTGGDPLPMDFRLTVPAGTTGPVTYSIDTGEGTDTEPMLLTGTLPESYGEVVLVPHTYTRVGDFKPVAVVHDGNGVRRHDIGHVRVTAAPPPLPAPTLSVSPTSGIVELPVTASLAASSPAGVSTTYDIDWGDGSPREISVPFDESASPEHTYKEAGSFEVRAQVTARRDSVGTTSQKTVVQRVVVSKDEPLLAALRDGGSLLQTVDGAELNLDATPTTPADDVVFSWDFGDGSEPGSGRTAAHTWDDPRDEPYTVTVTATRNGLTSTATQQVKVLDHTQTSVSSVLVRGADGNGLPGAVVVRSVGEQVVKTTTGVGGHADVYGLPEGVNNLDVFAPGHLPDVVAVTVVNGVGRGEATLKEGNALSAELAPPTSLDPATAAAMGVDLDAPANRNVLELSVQLKYQVPGDDSQPLQLKMAYNGAGDVGRALFTDPRTDQEYPCEETGPDGLPRQVACASGGSFGGVTASIEPAGPSGDQAVVVAFSPKAGSLKEFFLVEGAVALIPGSASSTARLEDVAATIAYNHTGLGLASLTTRTQSDVIELPQPVSVSETAGFSWILRGEKAGTWDVDMDVTATVWPFDAPLKASTKDPVQVRVYGTNAYAFLVQAPEQVTKDVWTRVRLGFHNVTTDSTVYGLTVELPKDDGQFQFQPGERALVELPALGPDETVYHDYNVLPNFTGTLDIAGSVISRTKGAEETGVPIDEVLPLEPIEEDVQNPPKLTATTRSDGRVDLKWTGVDGATAYRVYATDDLAKGFGEPLVIGPDAATSTGGTSATITVPMTYDPGSEVMAASRFSALRTGRMALAATPPDGKTILLQAVVKGANQIRHNMEKAVGGCASGETVDRGAWTMEGCLGQVGEDWVADLAKAPLKLNGLVIEPVSGSPRVKLTTATGSITTGTTSVKVGLDVSGTVVPLYQGPVALDLDNAEISLDATKDNLLGLPVRGAVKVKASTGGSATLSAEAEAPAVLGGTKAALTLSASNGGGVKVDDLSFDIAKGSLAGVAYSGKLTYGSTTSGVTWKVEGKADVPGPTDPAVTGSLAHAADGTLAAGELHATGLRAFGLVDLTSFDLTTKGGTSWTGALSASLPGGSAGGTASYVVDPKTNTVTSASIALDRLVVDGLLEITAAALTYAGDDSPTWTAKGTVADSSTASPATFAGTWTSDVEGVLTTGSVDVTKLPFAGFATLEQAHLAYTAATQAFSGSVDISTPGAVKAGTATFRVADRVLQDLSIELTGARFGSLVRISAGSLEYDKDAKTYALSATEADVANLVGLAKLDASRVGDTWTLTASGPDASGKTVGIDGTLTYEDGALTTGSMALDGLSFGGLVPINAVTLGYSPAAGWSVAGSGAEGDPSMAFTVKDGVVTSAKVDVPKAVLGGVAELAFSAEYATDTWTASAKVTTPKGPADFALDMTYTKGAFTAGSMSGTLALKGGLEVRIGKIAYSSDGTTRTWVGKADVVLPGGAAVGGSLRIVNGSFEAASVSVANLPTPVPLGTSGLFVSDAELAVQLEPTVKLSGSLGILVGPKSPVKVIATVTIEVANDGSATYGVSGDLRVVDTSLGTAAVAWDSGAGSASLEAQLGYSFPLATASAALSAKVDATGWHALGQGTLAFGPWTARAAVEADQDRWAACASVPDVAWTVGAAAAWGQTPTLDGVCSIASWQPPTPPAAPAAEGNGSLRMRSRLLAAAPGPGVPFVVPTGQPVYATSFAGTNAPPELTLTGPGGATFTTTGVSGPSADSRFLVIRDASASTTYVLLDRPAAGTWTALPLDASNPLTATQVAPGVDAPDVTATVTGGGATRTLSWSFPATPGYAVRLVEQSPDGSTRTLATSAGSGSVDFPALGSSGVRDVTAIVTQDGALRSTSLVATYDLAAAAPQPTASVTPDSGTGGTGDTGGTGGASPSAAPASPAASGSPAASPSVSPSASPSASNSPLPAVSGLFHPLVPARIYDSRRAGGPVLAGSDRSVPVLGLAGVPASGVTAVVVNVTGVGATAASDLQVYPTGRRPAVRTSNLNLRPGPAVAVLVTIAAGDDGGISLSTSAGRTDVVVDVVGWYGDARDTSGSAFRSLTPARVYDSRAAGGAISAESDREVTLAGLGGVPTTGVEAVVVNATVVGSTAATDVQLFPTGSRPHVRTSNVNVSPRQTRANLVVVKLGTGGKLSVSTSSGATHVVLDVVGWYGARTASDAGLRFTAVTPVRAYDSRVSDGRLSAETDRVLPLAGGGAVPPSARAIVGTVTVAGAQAPADVQLFPTGARPAVRTSNVNVPNGAAVPNLAVVGVGAAGAVSVSASAGRPHVLLDVLGYFAP